MGGDRQAERTVVVWCPDWPVHAAGAQPHEAVAVVAANRVVACSVAARREGVKRGLRRREAQARCPDLRIVPSDEGRDARAFEPVVAVVARCTPRLEVVRPGLCAFPTRGPSRYFGGDEALADRVVAALAGVPCGVGVADGRLAASLAARRAVRDDDAGRVGGSGRLVVAPGETASFLAPFPISALERPALADLLVRLGLRTLGDFAALPAADVVARFGLDGVSAHRLACGLDERPPAGREPPPELVVQRELDPPAERVDVAAFAAKGMADELHGRLAALGLSCTRVLIEAETEHGERLARLWRHEGALDAAAMAERVRWQLDGWLAGTAVEAGPTGGLTLLRLVPDEVGPASGRQLGFWGGVAAADDRAARALARVQGMLGPEAVTTAVLSGGRSPAEQATLVPWGEPREPARPGAPGDGPVRIDGRVELPPWPGQVPPPAPAVVHHDLLPAEVVDGDGRPVVVGGRGLAGAPPARLSVGDGRWATVVGWAGPWPVDERWWDAAAHRRRARMQLATDDGAAYLVALEGGRWWVEATYD
ncbi:MAG TPA: DNA polymerase Y family protein [Acidimicrobiales bacterium]|nr:DNA polymerase Y family protein [Acidimicrobiales bacterium]